MLQEGAGNETRLDLQQQLSTMLQNPKKSELLVKHIESYKLYIWPFDSCNNQKFDLTETFPENSKFTFVEILEQSAERKQFQNYLPGVKTSWLKDKILVCSISQSGIDLWVKYLEQKTSFETVQFWNSLED